MVLLALACGWLLGLYLASEAGLPNAVLIAGIGVALAGGVALRRRWPILLAALFITGVSAGALRFELHERGDASDTLAAYHGETVTLRGVVESYPDDLGTASRFRLSAREALADGAWRPVEGKALVTARPGASIIERAGAPTFRVGDLLEIRGRLERPQAYGDFDFPAYLERQGVRSVMAFPTVMLAGTGQGSALDRALAGLRRRLSDALDRTLPEPQNGLAQGILLGIRSDLDPALDDDFRASGTSHLLAISGQNVALLAGLALLLTRLLFWRYRWLALGLAAGLIWGYVLVAGLPPSAERAAIMATIYLAALALGRDRSELPALAFAAILITAIAPGDLRDAGFQLSFLAMLGILLCLPWLEDRLLAPERPDASNWLATVLRLLAASLVMSIAATLFTWPVVAFNFHYVSLAGIPATALASPLLLPGMVASALTAFVALASEHAAWVFGWAAWLSLSGLTWVVQLFAAIPLAALRVGDIARVWLGLYYAALAAVVWGLPRLAVRFGVPPATLAPWRAVPRVSAFSAACFSISAVAALTWWAALASPPKTLDVTVFDVGQGDAILVQTPSGHAVLVDGGPGSSSLVRDLDRRMPGNSRRLDLVVLTHTDLDHIGGLPEVLRRFDVRQVLAPAIPSETAAYLAWQRAVDEERALVTVAQAGQTIALDDLRIEVLHPPDPPLASTGADDNENAIVLRVTYRRFSLLLASDIQAVAEGYLASQETPLGSLVLKAPHHGSAGSSTQAFLEAVQPRIAVISVGQDNPFGHPAPAALDRLRSGGTRSAVPENLLFLTSRDGEVRLRTDGERLWIKTERGNDVTKTFTAQ